MSWWLWTKYAGVLLSFVDRKWFWFCIYYEVFLKIFVWTSPGAFDCLKVDVLNLFTSPGAFEILCQVSQNELWRIFLLPDTRLVEIWRWRSSPFFSMAFMLQRCVVFAEDDAKDLLIEALIWWNFSQNDKRNLKTIWLLFELENMFLILTPGIIQTPLWRTFDGGSPEDSMDDREVDSR